MLMTCVSVLTIFLTLVAYTVGTKNRVLTLERIGSLQHAGRDAHIGNLSLVGTLNNPITTGLYYTKIKLGSPPKEFHLQIDTGSDVTWVKCKSCDNCPKKSNLGFSPNLFDPARSSSATPLYCSDSLCTSSFGHQCTNNGSSRPCDFSVTYEDESGSWGSYFSDFLHFEDTPARIVFGCTSYLRGTFTGENYAIDGILGLGYKYPSVVLQVTPQIFSHCLGRDDKGVLVMGEIQVPGTVYSPLVQATGHYSLDLQSITVKGSPLPVNPIIYSSAYEGGGTIVDSGTTLAYLVADAYDPLVIAVNDEVFEYASPKPLNYDGTPCYKFSSIDMFPDVAFNFAGNASMVLTGKDYVRNITRIIDGISVNCLRFQKNTIENVTILGDLVLKDKFIIYDLLHQQLGWTDYNCSKTANWGTGWDSNHAAQPTITRKTFLLMIYVFYMILV